MMNRAIRLRYTTLLVFIPHVTFSRPLPPIVPDRRQFPRLLHHRLHVLSNARHLLSQLFLPRVRARRRGGGLRARRPRASRTPRASPPPRLETHRSRASPHAPPPSSSSSSSSSVVLGRPRISRVSLSLLGLLSLLSLRRFVSSRLVSSRLDSECPIYFLCSIYFPCTIEYSSYWRSTYTIITVYLSRRGRSPRTSTTASLYFP